jgi:hypothetical protein
MTKHPDIQPPSDIVQLMILSAGTYGLIWFWKSWSQVKTALDLKISAGWRAVFSNFNIHTLARDINWLAEKVKAQPTLRPYTLLGYAWFASIIGVATSEANDVVILATVATAIIIETIIIVTMQKKLNEYLVKTDTSESIIGPKNYYIYSIAIASGVLSWAGILMSIYGAITGVNPLSMPQP